MVKNLLTRFPHFPDLAYSPGFVTALKFRKMTGAKTVTMLCGIDEFNLPNLSAAERAAEVAKRCEAINRYDILDTPTEPEFD